MSRYIDSLHVQGSAAWQLDRLGRVTGSKAKCVHARSLDRTGEGVTRANYRMDLVLERVTGNPTAPTFPEREEMTWGKEQEPFSRMAYEAARGIDLQQSGFVYLPDIMAGCSVDAFIHDNGRLGVWESKSPKSKNHYGYLLGGQVPAEHLPQIVHNMWITGAEFADFTSFDPRMPEGLKIFIKRIERAELADRINDHERGVLQFLKEVDAETARMRRLAGMADADVWPRGLGLTGMVP